jgi:hypothetical protein
VWKTENRWEDNIKMDRTEIGWGVNWIYVAGWCVHGHEPLGSIKYG